MLHRQQHGGWGPSSAHGWGGRAGCGTGYHGCRVAANCDRDTEVGNYLDLPLMRIDHATLMVGKAAKCEVNSA